MEERGISSPPEGTARRTRPAQVDRSPTRGRTEAAAPSRSGQLARAPPPEQPLGDLFRLTPALTRRSPSDAGSRRRCKPLDVSGRSSSSRFLFCVPGASARAGRATPRRAGGSIWSGRDRPGIEPAGDGRVGRRPEQIEGGFEDHELFLAGDEAGHAACRGTARSSSKSISVSASTARSRRSRAHLQSDVVQQPSEGGDARHQVGRRNRLRRWCSPSDSGYEGAAERRAEGAITPGAPAQACVDYGRRTSPPSSGQRGEPAVREICP